MLLNTYRVGDRVMVTAKDEDYAFIDGWRGRVVERETLPGGWVAVECVDEGIEKQFIVPVDQVTLLVGR
jgi:hypothetical protein